MRSKDTVRVGAGAGTSDDRLLPALELAERGPQLPRHKSVGLGDTDAAILQRLRELAGRP